MTLVSDVSNVSDVSDVSVLEKLTCKSADKGPHRSVLPPRATTTTFRTAPCPALMPAVPSSGGGMIVGLLSMTFHPSRRKVIDCLISLFLNGSFNPMIFGGPVRRVSGSMARFFDYLASDF